MKFQNRFEQWGQMKGTVQIDEDQLRVVYLWGLKSKSYDEPISGDVRFYGYSCKGFGFSLGVNTLNKIK